MQKNKKLNSINVNAITKFYHKYELTSTGYISSEWINKLNPKKDKILDNCLKTVKWDDKNEIFKVNLPETRGKSARNLTISYTSIIHILAMLEGDGNLQITNKKGTTFFSTNINIKLETADKITLIWIQEQLSNIEKNIIMRILYWHYQLLISPSRIE